MGVRLVDGQEFRAKKIVSNATRWDTFNKLVPVDAKPIFEQQWGDRYQKSGIICVDLIFIITSFLILYIYYNNKYCC